MPQIGLGTYSLKAKSIQAGLEQGYRLLDTAWQYGNECEVGDAVKNAHIPREELFITTKVWTQHVREKKVRLALEKSLKNLKLDYIDLYLIHWPADGYEQAWEEMLILKEEGKIKNIGVSNFTLTQMNNIKRYGEVPTVNQIESHPYFANDEIIKACKEMSIVPQAWCPLGGPYSRLKEEKVVEQLARKYEKESAQIILKWHIQRGVSIIPRSGNIERQRSNLQVFDFCLEAEDMRVIDGLETGKRMGADPNNFDF